MAKRQAAKELNRDNWEEEEEPEDRGHFKTADKEELGRRVIKTAKRSAQNAASSSPFTGFAFAPAQAAKPATAITMMNGSATTVPLSKETQNTDAVLHSKLKSLNKCFMNWLEKHVNSNPYCDFTPVCHDYKRHIDEIRIHCSSKPEPTESATTPLGMNFKPSVPGTAGNFTPFPAVKAVANSSTPSSDSSKADTGSQSTSETKSFSFGISTASPATPVFSFSTKTSFGLSAIAPASTQKDSNAGAQCGSLPLHSTMPEASSYAFAIPKSCIDLKKPAFDLFDALAKDKETLPVQGGAVMPAHSNVTVLGVASMCAPNMLFSRPTLPSPSPAAASAPKQANHDATENSGSAAADCGHCGASTADNDFVFKRPPGSTVSYNFVPMPGTFVFAASGLVPATAHKDAKGSDNEEYVPPKEETTPVEEKDAVYTKRCKLFQKKDDSYADRGVGILYIKPQNDKHQLLIRADTRLGNILLNIMLAPTLPVSRLGKNNVALVCIPNPPVNSEGDSASPTTMLLRVRSMADADDLKSALDRYKGQVSS